MCERECLNMLVCADLPVCVCALLLSLCPASPFGINQTSAVSDNTQRRSEVS